MKKEKKPRDKSVVREYFELIAETAVFVFFVMTFVVNLISDIFLQKYQEVER